MDYDIEKAKRDIGRARKIIKKGEIGTLEKLGSGYHGKVFCFNSLALKREYIPHKNCARDTNRMRVKLSKEGIKRELDFAPYLGYSTTPFEPTSHRHSDKGVIGFEPSSYGLNRDNVAIMPRINGVAAKDKECFARIANMGAEGIERYFNTYLELKNMGFYIDYWHENTIVGEHINVVDLAIADKEDNDPNNISLREASRLLLDSTLGSYTNYADVEARFEIIGNMKGALCKWGDDGKFATEFCDAKELAMRE